MIAMARNETASPTATLKSIVQVMLDLIIYHFLSTLQMLNESMLYREKSQLCRRCFLC